MEDLVHCIDNRGPQGIQKDISFQSFRVIPHFTELAMTTVNSPACLLARNQFYRSISPAADMKPTLYELSETLQPPKQRQVTVWVTTSPHQDVLGQITTGWSISVVLRCPSFSSTPSKRPNSANRTVK